MAAGGAPRLRIRHEDRAAAGIERVPRTTGVSDGKPRLEDGRVLEVSNVVWCNGFGQNFEWIHLPMFDETNRPIHERGVVKSQPGLYFVGLPFLFGVTSALVGGVGRDAEFVIRNVLKMRTQLAPVPARTWGGGLKPDADSFVFAAIPSAHSARARCVATASAARGPTSLTAD